jgi:hypothetical protein
MTAASAYSPRERTGLALVVASFVLYAALAGVPFLPLGTNAQLVVAVGLVIAGEGTFWVGCLIAGKDFMMHLRRMLWPGSWRRKPST